MGKNSIIELIDLPPRPRRLDDAELAKVFGGGECGYGARCHVSCDCCVSGATCYRSYCRAKGYGKGAGSM